METFATTVFVWIDTLLIAGYRITGLSFLDFLIGTFSLSLWCVIVGELTVALALKINQRYFAQLTADVSQKERLSIVAYQAGDKEAYKALNQQANDAWGRQFFTMFGYSAGMFWVLPFAMAWMQTRFAGIDFPLAVPLSWIFGTTVGYPFLFIPLYILARIVFKYLRPRLPFFRNIQRLLDEKSAGSKPAPALPAV